MALKTDFNVAPYFDDYDEFKDYYRVLFRPGTAVQARELTQLQTILQKQIERFGSWAFNNGDIVYGCQIFDMPSVGYVRLMDFASNGSANSATLDVRDYVNAVAISHTSNLRAQVLYANAGFSTNYPDTNILYLKYINTGDGGESVFSNNELLKFVQVTPLGNVALANVYSWANVFANTVTTGNAHGIVVSEGVVFIAGEFVRVANSTFGLVNNFGTYAGNNVVGFDLIEEIITENQDETLVDNALGYPNENAPGAHRLKLTPYIVSLTPEEASLREKFNPIGTYNYGYLISKAQPSTNLYSIIGDVVSKRTYEESGNYVVNPFIVDTITTTPGNDVAAANSSSVLGRISSGVGYAQGNRVELLKTSYINMRRGVDTQTNRSQEIYFNYGNYFLVNEFSGTFLNDAVQTVKLYNTVQRSVSSRTYATTSPTGTLIGTAKMRCITYASGVPGSSTAQYYVHVFDISLTSGYSPSQVKALYFDGTNKGFADVVSAGVLGADNKDQLYSFGVTGVKNLRDQNNNINTDYYYRTSNTSATMITTGDIVVRLACSQPGGTDILPYVGGTTLIDTDAADIIITAKADVDSNALTGTVNVTSTSTIVRGNSTTFLSDFTPGDIVKIDGAKRIVTSVANNIYMTVDGNLAYTNNTTAYRKNYANGKIIPSTRGLSGPNTYVTIDDSTTLTIHSGQFPNTSVPVDVSYIVKRTVTTPAKKLIKKRRFVKINTASNIKGPWCLGFSDVHKINRIYGTANGVYTVAGADLTSDFIFDTGQKDTHYSLAYLYAKSSYSAASYPNLLIDLDYFAVDTTTGMGFFTVESYPIDDANTANTNAIQTKDITLYVNESGAKLPLRDHVDFRTPCINTANDCGVYDTSNGAQINTAISYSTLNPSATVNFSVPAAGINFPAYGKSLEADYTFYLGRKDLIMITPDNIVKVKEGVSSLNPQSPLYPENAMALSVLNIPPYPSLSTDQVDEFLTINQSATSLIRDANLAISCISVSNRRYTMRDIGTIDQRVSNLEYYTQLSLLEKKAKDLTITDQNGLDRFKNGIFVDPFSSFALADTSNQEFNIAIDQDKGHGRPKIIREVINIAFSPTASSNVVKTGRLITLNYAEVPFVTQQYATKYRSSALVAASWNGFVTLIPSYDNNINQKNTGSADIFIDLAAPWKDFAASPLAYSWGDWRTSVNTEVSSVTTGEVRNITRDWRGNLVSDQPVNPAPVPAATAAAGGLPLIFVPWVGFVPASLNLNDLFRGS
jgi:hypothetical protein